MPAGPYRPPDRPPNADREEAAWSDIYALAYDELRRLARQVRRGRAGDSLNTTAIVHEAYVKLASARGLSWKDEPHLKAIVARAMRQIIMDAADRRAAAKRGGAQPDLTFDEERHGLAMRAEHLVAMTQALDALEAAEPRQARVVECRFFAGMSVEDTAAALGVAEGTVKRDWRAARAWLSQALG